MKKIFALTIMFLLVATAAFAAGDALASGAVTNDQGKSIYGGSDATVAAGTTATLLAKCSKGVRAAVNFDSTHYAVMTKHDSGNKAFGTSYDSTAIYNTDLGTGALTATPSSFNSSAFTSWTTM